MERRNFLVTSISAAGTLFLRPAKGIAATYELENRQACRKHLKLLFRNWQASSRLGREYLTKYPQEDNFGFLYQALTNNGSCDLDRRHLAKLKNQDFKTENIVSVQGWYLAKSEAQAMALIALL